MEYPFFKTGRDPMDSPHSEGYSSLFFPLRTCAFLVKNFSLLFFFLRDEKEEKNSSSYSAGGMRGVFNYAGFEGAQWASAGSPATHLQGNNGFFPVKESELQPAGVFFQPLELECSGNKRRARCRQF